MKITYKPRHSSGEEARQGHAAEIISWFSYYLVSLPSGVSLMAGLLVGGWLADSPQ
ncbi:hypothetical protein GIY30_11105 [Gordonia sp. HNM0687]|uniref:Uncharacterized protein n=1 Tax=Gordonia mangrovi TaxID=2665643 RepID=A0A6L7GRA0_9ACTN|nr:hypothetical protein [Gordonia mangrovi]MXP21897.1 hypothetical protein [Gordonia mangrovi]UVF76266.1 hypothetical protein NWF22_12715 [Gordonia mangrovi]